MAKLPEDNKTFSYLDEFRKIPGLEDFLNTVPPPFAAMMFASCANGAINECTREDAILIAKFICELFDPVAKLKTTRH